jgi:hypothetical protein
MISERLIEAKVSRADAGDMVSKELDKYGTNASVTTILTWKR